MRQVFLVRKQLKNYSISGKYINYFFYNDISNTEDAKWNLSLNKKWKKKHLYKIQATYNK